MDFLNAGARINTLCAYMLRDLWRPSAARHTHWPPAKPVFLSGLRPPADDQHIRGLPLLARLLYNFGSKRPAKGGPTKHSNIYASLMKRSYSNFVRNELAQGVVNGKDRKTPSTLKREAEDSVKQGKGGIQPLAEDPVLSTR